jgi:multiple sugar transport system ATP-binding protein
VTDGLRVGWSGLEAQPKPRWTASQGFPSIQPRPFVAAEPLAVAQVVLDEVTKDFPGGVRALNRFSLDVADGEFVVVVGPSGSGKSTLLRLVAGLERVTSGTLRIGNRTVNDLPPRRRNVAMAFQHPALYPHLTVAENLAFPLRLRNQPRSQTDEKVRIVAEQLSIAPLLDRKPAAISGGERQRVALGRVLVRDADCNLFDEPLAHLDPPLVEQLQSVLIESHRRRPTTTLFVTHDQQEALMLGSRVVVLSDGKIQQIAPPLDIYDHPANRFVAGFFGSPPMNFLEGRLTADDGRLSFASGALRVPLRAEQSQRLLHCASMDVIGGIRPEAICEVDSESAPERVHQFSAAVVSSEVRGDRIFRRIETAGGQQLVARGADRFQVAPRSTRQFILDLNRLHFFELSQAGGALL